jgi:hypothetical protein
MKKTEIRKIWALSTPTGATALQAAAQTKDLSGTWKLNLAESFLAAQHPASDYRLTKIIEQKNGAIQITDIAENVSMDNIPMPNSKTTTELVPDGKQRRAQGPAPFPGLPPQSVEVSAVWQGGTLLVTHLGNSLMGESTTLNRYFLSDDGSQLIELVEGHSLLGDSEQRLVFDRQGQPE